MMLIRKSRNYCLKMFLWGLFASLWCCTAALRDLSYDMYRTMDEIADQNLDEDESWIPEENRVPVNESYFVSCMETTNKIESDPNDFFQITHKSSLRKYIYVTATHEHQKAICKDIISDGSIDYYFEERVYNYFLHKEEVSGFDCFVDPKYTYDRKECLRKYQITTNSPMLNCSRSKNPLAKLVHDLPQFSGNMFHKNLELRTTHIISWSTGNHLIQIECHLIGIGKYMDRYSLVTSVPFIMVLTKENSDFKMTCSNFIEDKTLWFNGTKTAEYGLFRYIDGYDCKVSTDDILENNNDTLKIRSSTDHLFCQEKDVENKRGSVLDVRFYLFKKEISGFECDVDKADLVKRHTDSYEYLSERKGLVCHRWISRSKPIPTGAYKNKIIQCHFEKLTIDEYACFQTTKEKRNFIHVTTDDNLRCNSLIWNGEITNRYHSASFDHSIYFYLYKKEYSGYECHVPNARIQNENAIMYKVTVQNEAELNCTKVKDNYTVKEKIFFLDCYYQDTIMINGTPSKSSYFYSAPTIIVTSPNKENCDKIIQGFIKKETETNLVSLVLYKEKVSGYNCSLEHNERIKDLGTMFYIERNHTIPLECKKIETLAPENVTILGTDDENIDEETNKIKGEQKQVGQKESEGVDEAFDVQLKSEELIVENQTTPEPLTMKNTTELTRNSENFFRNPEEQTVTKSDKKMKPDEQQITPEPSPKKKTPEVDENSENFARNYEEEQQDAIVGENVEPAKRRNWKSAMN